jgi:anti-sigma factor RsiW
MAGTRHPTDWERQQERLSAYLDGELAPAERPELARHLATCPECTVELAQLQRVRALLGALPAPAMPGSFALPTTPRAQSPASHQPQQRRPSAASRPAWYGASQWVGGIAACIGLFLLLGTALLGSPGPHLMGTSPASGGMRDTAATQATHTPLNAKANPTTQSGTSAPSAQSTPTGTPPPTPTEVISPASQPNESEPPFGPIAGAGLLAGGIGLLIAGRVARRAR